MDWTVKSSVEGSGGGGGGGGAMVEVVNKRRRMERNILWNSSRLSSREGSALYCTAVGLGYQYLALVPGIPYTGSYTKYSNSKTLLSGQVEGKAEP